MAANNMSQEGCYYLNNYNFDSDLNFQLQLYQLSRNKVPSINTLANMRIVINLRTGPGQAPVLFSQYPVRREWFRPKTPKISSGCKRIVPVNKTLKATPLSILNNVDPVAKELKAMFFVPQNSLKAIAVR